jgi:peptidyl-dipeptidase A
VKFHHLLLPCVIALGVLPLSACRKDEPPSVAEAPPPAPKPANPAETADQFIARVNQEIRAIHPETNAAEWLSVTFITSDTQLLASTANQRWLSQLNGWIEQAKQYDGKEMSPQTERALHLLKRMTSMPAPRDPIKLAELTRIVTRLEGMYGSSTYCTGEGDAKKCRSLGELEDTLRTSRDYDRLLDAWQGWHSIAQPMREDYVRFIALVNEGAKEMGYANAGEMWRSGYDMPPADIVATTDRLWQQVKPLYEQLHCYARDKLEATYGTDKARLEGGMIPAHLLGNMWQQDWGNLWDILQPYKNAGSLDITGALKRQYQINYSNEMMRIGGSAAGAQQLFMANRAASLKTAQQMTERAQDFYTSLNMPNLPESYWQRSQFIKPLDRDVVCHASAWNMDMAGDVRTKMCIQPTEEEFATIYHELGHVYYSLAYNVQPPLFQSGANDGFHEAIGDTIILAMTPEYLHSIGLVDEPLKNSEALINAQMRMALSKVSFLPFGLMIDQWRWKVFDGSITPDRYNQSWWELKAVYQGVAPSMARDEEFFDPGAKYHIPGNVPYLRYFLAHILQFQFYKSLCEASGHQGPLYSCTFYGSEEAGQKLWAMLQKGSSQPWQVTLKEMTGSDRIDARPLLEYFAPLQEWLKVRNQNLRCGWYATVATAPVSAMESKVPANSPPATTSSESPSVSVVPTKTD